MHRRIALVLAPVALAVVASPAAAETTLRPRVGDTVSFRQPENPSTGYQWKLLPLPVNPPVRLVETRYRPSNPVQPPMPGAGGERTWEFRAVHKGTMHVTLRLVRSKGAPARTVRYRFIVS